MRVIDRLVTYIEYKDLTPYAFERSVMVANGYIKKQLIGKGSLGSGILIRIHARYPDLDLAWLVTGEGDMLNEDHPRAVSFSKNEMIHLLNEKIILLEKSLADKDEIIQYLKR